MGDTKRTALLFIITTLLWFLRMVLPGVKYIFIPVLALLVVYVAFSFCSVYSKKHFLLEFLKVIMPLWVLALFYVLGIFFTGQLFTRNLNEILELLVAFVLLGVYFILLHVTKTTETLLLVFQRLVRYISYSSLLVALLGLSKYLMQLKGMHFPFETPIGTSINTDKNFYALYSFLGIIGFIPRLLREQRLGKRWFLQLLVSVLLINIVLSYSYRAILLLAVFFVFILVIHPVSWWFGNTKWLRNLTVNTRMLVLVGFILAVIVLNPSFQQYKVVAQLNRHVSVYQSRQMELTAQAFHFKKWDYAWVLFSDLPFHKKLIGDGFGYLEKYGAAFHNDASRSDYPHNPILSALLYSGLVGAIFAFLFLFIAVYYGFIYFKKYPLYSLMLFTSFVFVFFSGNSLFSVPVFLFLFSLSFLIRHQEITDLHIDMNLEKPGSRLLKESFDYMVGTLLFVILLPVLALFALFVLLTLGWPVFYAQKRVGQNGKTFYLHKFRTMKKSKSATSVAAAELDRVTGLGAFMRKSKVDELPELWNIMRGDMSFVGPRPDVPGYADKLSLEDAVILKLKPGLTGPASLKYINEEEVLAEVDKPQQYNDEVIFPDKVKINKAYMTYWSFWLDIKIIIFTLLRKPLKEDYFQ
jgi:lipopolysaccharide/colanic/teichoic acid biosynthesis glycosyltransferase